MSQNLVRVRSSDLRKGPRSAAPDGKPRTPSKTDFILSLPASVPPGEIVERAARQGLAITKNLVYLVRSREAARGGAPRRPRGRPRKEASPATPPGRRSADGVRGASKPALDGPTDAAARRKFVGRLSPREKDLAWCLLDVGLDRAEELLYALRGELSPRR